MGLYSNNKELMAEDDFEKTSLKTWKKAMEKLMKPVEHLERPRRALRGGTLSHCPTGASCTQSWMQLRDRLDIQLRDVCLISFLLTCAFFYA